MQSKKPPVFNNPNHVLLAGADLYRGDCLAVIPGLQGQLGAIETDTPYSNGG